MLYTQGEKTQLVRQLQCVPDSHELKKEIKPLKLYAAAWLISIASIKPRIDNGSVLSFFCHAACSHLEMSPVCVQY